MKPDFDKALQTHLDAIANRDLAAFEANLTRGDTLYTIVQNGHAFTTPAELIAIHRQWRIVHDQNTALDYPASSRSAGVELG